MNPVIGLDVSKGESHAQAFADRGTPYGKTYRFKHDLEGLASFLRSAQDIESFTGQRPAVVLEATGHYRLFDKTFISSRNCSANPNAPGT
ncbi:transposase [Paenibacillus solisilvae]|uniref:Transposase n=1 Tax=Paenibacillus solisilvae TaxID=2486751 RepID=A0ABW0VX03_9BACL